MPKSGYASYCTAKKVKAGDPLSSSFPSEEVEVALGDSELEELDTSLDIESMEDPVFLPAEDGELIEEMLTPITEDGEPMEMVDFDSIQETRFNYDEAGKEAEGEEDTAKKTTKVIIDEAEEDVEDLSVAMESIEEILV